MAASFALHLDHRGISLHRLPEPDAAGPGARVAHAPLDDPQFEAAVAAMQATVAAEGDSGAPVLLVLPDSQILYTEAEPSGAGRDADAARVREALAGATPYDLSELVYDWREAGGRLHIAVVARETLDEARAFAEAHGFTAAGYLGAAEEGVFEGRPRFRDRETGAGAAPARGEAADPPVEADTPPSDDAPGPHGPVTEASAPEAPASDVAASAAPASEVAVSADADSEATDDAPAAGAAPAEMARTEPPPPTFASIRRAPAPRSAPPVGADDAAARGTGAATPPSAGDPTRSAAAAPDGAAPRITPVETDDEASATAASLAPAAAAPHGRGEGRRRESRLARLFGSGETDRAEPGGADAAASRAPGDEPRAEPPLRPGPDAARQGPATPTGSPARTSPANAAPSAARRAPAAPAPVRAGAPTPPAPAASGSRVGPAAAPIVRRSAGADTAGALPPPTGAAPSESPEMDEAASLTVFGARRPRRGGTAAGGGPRFLGLTLTLGLLALMILVALWSLWSGAAEGPESVADGRPPPSAVASAPAGPDAPAAGAAERPAAGTDIAGAPRSETAESAAPPDTNRNAARAASARADSRDGGTSPGAVPPRTGPAAGPTLAALRFDSGVAPVPDPPGPVTPAPVPAASSAEAPRPAVAPEPLDLPAAERAYARSGVWQRAPRRGIAPSAPALPEITAAVAAPREVDAEAPAPPRPLPRSAAATLPAPPLPPGSVLGPDGLVVPTAEGARAPGGYTLFTGPPPVLPPTRPGAAGAETADSAGSAPPADARPEPRPGRSAEIAAGPETPRMRPRARPALRSAPPAPATQDDAATAERTPERTAERAEAGAVAARPRARPGTLAAEADRLRAEAARADEVARAEADAAAAALSASDLAVARAPEPRARPANVAQAAAATSRQESTPVAARSPRVTPEAPSGARVARRATERNALRMNAVALVGVYGAAGQRRALVRLPSGRYLKVQVGDRLDGGQVAAIGSDALRYVKRGRDVVLRMPSS